MPEFRWIEPAERELVVQHRLYDLDAVLARQDGIVTAEHHRGRDTLRLELSSTDQAPQVLLLKRERITQPYDLFTEWWRSRGFRTAVRRELAASQALIAAGMHCPRPIACLERAPWPALGCLVVQLPPGAAPVGEILAGRLADGARREALFTCLARETARLHALGFAHGELYANRVLAAATTDGWQFWFSDFEHGLRRQRVRREQRAWDLAALVATLPRHAVSRQEQAALLDAYLAAASLQQGTVDLLALVDQGVRQLLSRRHVWRIRESGSDEELAVRALESVQTGTMWVDREFRPALEQCGLDSFEAVMSTTKGEQLRALRDRENWRIELHAPHAPPWGAYLKKHHVRTLGSWWRAKLGSGPGRSPGRAEARNAARLARTGIAAMRLIAFGEKLHPDGLLESFVLTEELAGFTQLDHFLRNRFPSCRNRRTLPPDRDLDRLIADVADLAARFHLQGYNHRDLYCCHFFIKEPARGVFQVNLIDLQRVERRRRFRDRWLVKDLAELAYSAPRDRIDCRHKLAFIKRYLGVRKLRAQDKRLIRRVLAKQHGMERTLGLHP